MLMEVHEMDENIRPFCLMCGLLHDASNLAGLGIIGKILKWLWDSWIGWHALLDLVIIFITLLALVLLTVSNKKNPNFFLRRHDIRTKRLYPCVSSTYFMIEYDLVDFVRKKCLAWFSIRLIYVHLNFYIFHSLNSLS